jgi:hypothetical protein
MALVLQAIRGLANSDQPIGSARVERLDEIRYLAKFVVPTSSQRRA